MDWVSTYVPRLLRRIQPTRTGISVISGYPIIADYQLTAPGLKYLALVVSAADVKGQESVAAEGLGLRAIAEGFAAMNLSDGERFARGFPIYDALYEYSCRREG